MTTVEPGEEIKLAAGGGVDEDSSLIESYGADLSTAYLVLAESELEVSWAAFDKGPWIEASALTRPRRLKFVFAPAAFIFPRR